MPTILGMDLVTFVGELGLFVSTIVAIIALWVERDPERPIRSAIVLTCLMSLACVVAMYQGWAKAASTDETEKDLGALVTKLDGVMQSDAVELPELNSLVKDAVVFANEKHPVSIRAIAQRVSDEGGNPADVLGSYLPKEQVAALERNGVMAVPRPARPELVAASPTAPRRAMTFGSGPALMRSDDPSAGPVPFDSIAQVAPVEVPSSPSSDLTDLAAVSDAGFHDATGVAAAPASPAIDLPTSPAAIPPATPTPLGNGKTKRRVRAANQPQDEKPAGDTLDVYDEAEKDLITGEQ